MMERTQIDKQTLTIDGICYTAEDARPCGHEPSRLQTAFYEQYGKDSFQASLADFLAEWFSTSEQVLVHTSGSTGTPKPMWVEKQRMMASACLTCSFLGLKENDTALLCMPLKYIAGKMVVVRALVYGLNLIGQSSQRTSAGKPVRIACFCSHDSDASIQQSAKSL